MAPGSDETPDGGSADEGKILSPEELDISEDERVKELDDGRYVVSSGDPIANTGANEPSRVGSGRQGSRPELEGTDTESTPNPTPDRSHDTSTTDNQPAQLSAPVVHDWMADDLAAADSRYGFDITAAFDGSVAQQRMVSNDVVATFETLLKWYAQRTDRNTPVEAVLGILLMEANVPVRYPPKAVKQAMHRAGLSPDDTIADLVEAVDENDGLQL